MHRRVWIRQVLVAGVGMLCLPALAKEPGAIPVNLHNLRISDAGEELVAHLAEAILPTTDTPGARALNLHQFVLKMLDDCYDRTAIDRLQQGLQQVDDFARQKGGAPFAQLETGGQLVVLRAIRDDQQAPADLKYLVDQVRRWTIRGFETSQYVLMQVHPYELVPGRWDGCKKIANV